MFLKSILLQAGKSKHHHDITCNNENRNLANPSQIYIHMDNRNRKSARKSFCKNAHNSVSGRSKQAGYAKNLIFAIGII